MATVEQLLIQLVQSQNRQTEGLEALTAAINAERQVRQQQMAQWKAQNPTLAEQCQKALAYWTKIQEAVIEQMTTEIIENGENLQDCEFTRRELLDRFGQSLVHLNHVGLILTQLGATE